MAQVITQALATFPELGPFHAANPHQQALCSAISQLTQALKPNAVVQARKQVVITELQAIISAAVQAANASSNLSVQPYGSSVSGLALPDSDVDLAVHGTIDEALLQLYTGFPGYKQPLSTQPVPENGLISLEHLTNPGKIAVLQLVSSALMGSGVCGPQGVTLHASARVPVAKCVHAATGVSVDLVCGILGRQLKAHTLVQAAKLSNLMAPLYRLVKVWAQAHDLNDAVEGTFNSWSLALMVLFSLQTCRPTQMPPLWKLFMPSLPEPASPRLLNRLTAAGADVQLIQHTLAQHMDHCTTWCEGYAAGKADAKQGDAMGPSKDQASWDVLAALHWFMLLFAGLFESLAEQRLSDQRVSVWLGRMYKQPFPVPYRVLIEDPFDISDNSARTLGTKDYMADASLNTVSYIAHMLRTSEKLLRAVRSSECTAADLQAAFLWLWGPAGVSCLAPRSRAALGVPAEVYQQVIGTMQSVRAADQPQEAPADEDTHTAQRRRAQEATRQAHKVLVSLTRLGANVMVSRAAWQERLLTLQLAQQCNFEAEEVEPLLVVEDHAGLDEHMGVYEGTGAGWEVGGGEEQQAEAWGTLQTEPVLYASLENAEGETGEWQQDISAQGYVWSSDLVTGMAAPGAIGAEQSPHSPATHQHTQQYSPARYAHATVGTLYGSHTSSALPWSSPHGSTRHVRSHERHVYPRSEGSTDEVDEEAGEEAEGGGQVEEHERGGEQATWGWQGERAVADQWELLPGEDELLASVAAVQVANFQGEQELEAGVLEEAWEPLPDEQQAQDELEVQSGQPSYSLALSPEAPEWRGSVQTPVASPVARQASKGMLSPSAAEWRGSQGSSSTGAGQVRIGGLLSPAAAEWSPS